jgi:hypothetical protein
MTYYHVVLSISFLCDDLSDIRGMKSSGVWALYGADGRFLHRRCDTNTM